MRSVSIIFLSAFFLVSCGDGAVDTEESPTVITPVIILAAQVTLFECVGSLFKQRMILFEFMFVNDLMLYE